MLQELPADLFSLLRRAVAQAGAMGVRLWLVGGVVRDLMLGLPLGRDVDLAVEGEVGALAEALAARTGGRVAAAHAPFGTATVEAPGAAGSGSVTIDLARTRVERYPRPAALPEVAPASIKEDLIRRDFSVNAMALELLAKDGELQAGRLLDPFGGRRNLAARRLRLLHRASLRDDPTRLLRGVRLAARLGMEPERGSRQQIAAALQAGYLGLLTPERVLAELCLALKEPRPDAALRVADSWGVTPQILPGLAWSPELAARCEVFAAAAGPEGDPLIWAGLLLYGLDAAALRALGERYPLPAEGGVLLRQIPPLRALAPALAIGPPNSAIDRLLRGYSAPAIRVLHYAEPAAAEAAERYLSALRPARPPIDGNDLRRLGIAPGPGMGHMLEELRAAALDGEVTTPAEAEAWVLARVSPSS